MAGMQRGIVISIAGSVVLGTYGMAQEPAQADAAPIAPRAATMAEPDEHVVSQSRMFSVSGGDSLRMGAIATKADEVRGRVNALFGFEDNFRYAVSIRLLGRTADKPVANPIRTRISIIGKEPNFQIRVHSGGGVDVERLTNAIITMVLYEHALREVRADALPDSVQVPEWLVTGVQQALLWKSGKADRRKYRNLFDKAEILSIAEILSTKNAARLDASSREVYEVSCGVLMMCLVSREGGQAQLRELVAESVLAEGSPTEIIASHFHELGIDEGMLSRWWALQLASMAAPTATEMLTPVETEKKLREVITIFDYDEETRTSRPVSLDNVYALMQVPEWRSKLRPMVDRLTELSVQAFPGYRPVIAEYQRLIAELLADARPDEVQQILGPVRELREAYITTSTRARDYLDWYEITYLGNNSSHGSFMAYREAMRLLRKEEQGAETHMSRYLKDIEMLYQLAEEEPLPDSFRIRNKPANQPQEDE